MSSILDYHAKIVFGCKPQCLGNIFRVCHCHSVVWIFPLIAGRRGASKKICWRKGAGIASPEREIRKKWIFSYETRVLGLTAIRRAFTTAEVWSIANVATMAKFDNISTNRWVEIFPLKGWGVAIRVNVLGKLIRLWSLIRSIES